MTNKEIKYYFVVNPTAKSGKGISKWKIHKNKLKKQSINFSYDYSKYANHSIELAKKACEKNYAVIVAVGGDGTINEVLNGIMHSDVLKKPAMGILYSGTSPDICSYHNIPINVNKAYETLLKNLHVPIDIGKVAYKDNMGNSIVSYFLCSVNLGIGAAVADGSNSGLRKYFGDFIGTFLSILKSLAGYKPADFNCIIDGKEKIFSKTTNMTIGKNPYIASGLKVNIPIKYDDGKMYLFSINNFSKLELLFNINKFYKGIFQNHPNNTMQYIKDFECELNPNAPLVEFDGDPRGYLPCKINIVNKGLALVK